jgi:hypothetical protein
VSVNDPSIAHQNVTIWVSLEVLRNDFERPREEVIVRVEEAEYVPGCCLESFVQAIRRPVVGLKNELRYPGGTVSESLSASIG